MATILFVHGYMNTGAVWREWKEFFEERGYTCYNPSWLYLERPIKELQENPDSRLRDETFMDVVNHYIEQIEQMDELPILIGHSLGGVLVQKLLELGYGKMAVAINSGPPKGIVAFNKDFLWSNLQLTLNIKGEATVLMSPKWYHKYVTNDLTYSETEKFVAENCVPASRKIAQTIEKIDFRKAHAPLLFIAGGKDKSQPAIINQKNAQAYTDAASVTEFKLFQGRTHNTLNQKDWQQVATYVADWLEGQLKNYSRNISE